MATSSDEISLSEKTFKSQINPFKFFQSPTLERSQTLLNLDPTVESINTLQIVSPGSNHSNSFSPSDQIDVGQGKIDFLESKISLLELLLDAKTTKINEQAQELDYLKKSISLPSEDENIGVVEEDHEIKRKLEQEQMKKESMELEESRRIAASFIHAESLYLNKLDLLECQIALERMSENNQPPTRLFPISGSVSADKLEQTLISVQKILKLEPNISEEGLKLLLSHLQKTLEETDQIIELQHKKLQQILDDQNQSSTMVTSSSSILAKELLQMIFSLSAPTTASSTSKEGPANPLEMKEVCISLLQAIQKESKFLESTCLRLEEQLVINLEIKRLLVSLQVDKSNMDLALRLNHVLQENADLRQQLHFTAPSNDLQN